MRKAFVPESWITSKVNGETLRTLIAVALHADKNGMCFIKNETLCSLLDKEVRQVQLDLNRGVKLGLISRKFNESGRRYFVVNMDERTGAMGLRPAQSDDMSSECAPRNGNAPPGAMGMRPPAQWDCAPPDTPHIGTPYFNTKNKDKDTRESVPDRERLNSGDTESVSLSGAASLPLSTAKAEIPPDLKSMASQLGLESWIGELQFQQIPLDDWRIRHTLGVMHSNGGKSGSRYAWGVFRNLPEQQPKPAEIATTNGKIPSEAEQARSRARLEALK